MQHVEPTTWDARLKEISWVAESMSSSHLASLAGVIGRRVGVICAIIAVIGYSRADTNDDFNRVNYGGGCPSSCSGHGYCTSPKTENCSCHQGWGGGDCSIRELRCWSKRVDCFLGPTYGPFHFHSLFVVKIADNGSR